MWPLHAHFSLLLLNLEFFVPIVLKESKTLRFVIVSKVAKLVEAVENFNVSNSQINLHVGRFAKFTDS